VVSLSEELEAVEFLQPLFLPMLSILELNKANTTLNALPQPSPADSAIASIAALFPFQGKK
jgi:hypothetical protein